MKTHYKILNSLYGLYKSNSRDTNMLDNVANIAWAMEHDLNFDSMGYHELAELIKTPESDNVSRRYYVQVIESSLEKLKDGSSK